MIVITNGKLSIDGVTVTYPDAGISVDVATGVVSLKYSGGLDMVDIRGGGAGSGGTMTSTGGSVSTWKAPADHCSRLCSASVDGYCIDGFDGPDGKRWCHG